ncbi:MAG TPA: ATP-binding cassette domain-containing protein [Mycobacteriales bacterium]|jgi:ABC-type branched-subunit amino acid transport system ATPase component|nr:ATP-binding cassette domain-containing protein [Mycobacteriales bacterium]
MSDGPASDSNALLEVRNVDFSYGSMQVLFDVSLQVRAGESLALLGTNGAGKSTLLRVITGLERAQRGRIFFAGDDITATAAERLPRRGLLLVAGGNGVFADMTVSDNLDMAALPARRQRQSVRERRAAVYDVFPHLAKRLDRRAGTLSGGEQQQLALAKALLLEPRLLCIDELSLGLAPIIVGQLMQLVRDIQKSGVALVLVEQSLNIAAEMCDRAVFMEKGEIRFEGAPKDLLERDDLARAAFLGTG